MNYLAHFYLSNNDEDHLCGNFIADHVKGKAYRAFPKRVQQGILLHREIDSYTDSHPVFLQSKQRLFAEYRHYAAVIVDMFYDHFLAVHWDRFSALPLVDFTSNCYGSLLKRESLPVSAEFMLRYMHEQDWLSNYATKSGISKALTGLSNRTAFDSKMENSVEDLYKDYDLYSQEFLEFFPQLISHCEQWMSERKD